jgi:hypothetical protein
VINVGDKLERTIEEKGWKAKIDNFITKKFRKSSSQNVVHDPKAEGGSNDEEVIVSTPYIEKQ